MKECVTEFECAKRKKGHHECGSPPSAARTPGTLSWAIGIPDTMEGSVVSYAA